MCAAVLLLVAGTAEGQTLPRPVRKGHKLRIKIDSSPQQAAVYVDSKDYGIEGYTPTTLRLPKGVYKIILELPGFKPVEKNLEIKKSQAFLFTMERAARPAVVDVRPTGNQEAAGAQLYLDGALMGTVPARVEAHAGKHLVEVKKPGFKEFREQVDLAEGETRTMAIDLVAEAKKGALLVTADVAGAEVWVDGQKRDATPTLVTDLLEGEHTIEVRREGMPAWRQVVRVVGNQQTKVEARIGAQAGSLRVLSSTPGVEVIVDGEPKGGANQEITGLKPGQHVVEVRAAGFQPQSLEVQVVAGEQRIARVDLRQGAESQTARVRIVTPVPDAEVFIDGASLGKAPIERTDLSPGKHYVVVRKQGYAEWKRELDLEAGKDVSLTAELSASGTIKVLSNVPGADVFIDGQMMGRTPLSLDTVQAGEHLVEVKKPGYLDAKQPFRIEGGEQKILSADLSPVRTGPSAADLQQTYRSTTSFSAVTVEPNRFTADIYGGFFPFGGLRLTVGALRRGMLGLDAGVEVRTVGILTEGLAHARFQWLKAGPVAMGVNIAIGGGGGPGGRNDFVFEAGIPFTLLFGQLVRFTAHPYAQIYTDRNCPETMKAGEPAECGLAADRDGHTPRDRFSGFRLMLRAALEISVHQIANIFFIFEADPIAPRHAYDGHYSGFIFARDPQVYGRTGVTFKF